MFPSLFTVIIMQLQDSSSWKGHREDSILTSCLKQGQLWSQNKLLRFLLIWVLRTSQDGESTAWDCTASLGSLFCCLTVLMGKKFLFIQSEFSCFYSCLFSVILPPTSLFSFLIFISASCTLFSIFGIKNTATWAKVLLKIKPCLCQIKRKYKTSQDCSRLS